MEETMKQLTLEFFGRGKYKVSPEAFFETENGFLLDVRSKEEAESIAIQMGCHPHIECRNIPVDEIPDRMEEIPRHKPIGVFCQANVRSSIVYAWLLSKGFPDVRVIVGGFPALTEALLPGKVLKASLSAGQAGS